jgi:N-acetylneuraminic acid mutarotase
MGVPRQEVGGAAIGDRVYVVGGVAAGESAPSAVVEAYDTIADRWDVVAPLPAPRRAVAAAATGGVLYAAGGFASGDGAVADVFTYDPAADAWTARASLPTPRGAAAAAAFDGKVYVAGGRRDGTALHDLAVYDPATDAWTVLPLMPHAREGLGLAATDLLLYAMGGRDGGPPLTIGELFHPPGNEWFKEVAPLLTARSRFGLAGLGPRVYAFGGDVPDGVVAGSGGTFPDVEMFDPTRNSWFRQPDLPTPRAGLTAVPLGGRIYVVGGATPGFDPTGATEIFLPESADALTVKKLALARRGKRLRLIATLPGATEDPAGVQLRVRVREGEVDVAAVTLGTGALIAKGRGWRAAPGTLAAGAAVSLRRRRDDLVLRFAGTTLARPTTRRGLGVVVELGPHILSGTLS